MSSVIKVNACVYSRIGYGRTDNTSSFYMNGKFSSEHHIDNVQASMENKGAEYFFAVADNMVLSNPEEDIHISILKEIGKFHEKITVSGGGIHSKIEELESRINDTERLLSGSLEMNHVPVTDYRWNMGFSGLLFTEGQFAALTGGSGRVYMMRDGMFRPLAGDTAKARQAIDEDDVELPGEDNRGNVVVSDIYDIQEGDSFILLSDGLFEALGEEKIEDLMALRSDSSYIAYRLVDEAMKRKSSGDLTALVVQAEKLTNGQPVPKKPTPRQAQQSMKAKVDKLNKAPAVTYKYNKKNSNRHQSIIFAVLVILTVMVLFGFIYLIITSLINTGKNTLPPTSTVSATATPETSTAPPEETDIVTEEPTESVAPVDGTPTPAPATPTPKATDVKEHKVKSGESINSIARLYYGDITLVNKLCAYNNISDPNKIKIGQVIKIPPKEVLAGQ